jgi:hypothetical protein
VSIKTDNQRNDHLLEDQNSAFELPNSWHVTVSHNASLARKAHLRRGGVSVLCTMTMPFLIFDRLTRFNASDTHCPASAESTGALYALLSNTVKGAYSVTLTASVE